MKKIILMGALLVAAFAQAQVITVFNGEEEVIDGYNFTSTSLEEPEYLYLHVTNVSDESIRLKLKMVSVENLSGEEFMVQFCFAENCYYDVTAGVTAPPATGGMLFSPGADNIPPGETETPDHFYSVDPGDGSGLVKYNMSIVQVEGDGTETATLRTFSYTIDTTAGTTDFSNLKNLGINLKNTVVASTLDLSTDAPAKLEVIDLNGKIIRNFAITAGSQSIDLSGLSSAVYFARFTTEANKTAQVKIVKN